MQPIWHLYPISFIPSQTNFRLTFLSILCVCVCLLKISNPSWPFFPSQNYALREKRQNKTFIAVVDVLMRPFFSSHLKIILAIITISAKFTFGMILFYNENTTFSIFIIIFTNVGLFRLAFNYPQRALLIFLIKCHPKNIPHIHWMH